MMRADAIYYLAQSVARGKAVTISTDSIQRLESHWAIRTVGTPETRERVLRVADARLVDDAIGLAGDLEFADGLEETRLLDKLALAYEIAAMEGLDAAS